MFQYFFFTYFLRKRYNRSIQCERNTVVILDQ